jgi:glycosyltransferase involved in cell wall biosynthesis
LAGSGSLSYEIHLRELIKNYGIESKVTWHGHVDLPQKQNLYNASTLFVMPSLHENFGLAAAEAMAVGIPVILSDQVGLAPDVKLWGAGSIITVGDSVALADAVRAALQSGRLTQMGILAKKLIETKFSSARFSKDLLGMYSRALNGPAKG